VRLYISSERRPLFVTARCTACLRLLLRAIDLNHPVNVYRQKAFCIIADGEDISCYRNVRCETAS